MLLYNEKSPYLLQHAHNPVDWFPWNQETFAKAKVRISRYFFLLGVTVIIDGNQVTRTKQKSKAFTLPFQCINAIFFLLTTLLYAFHYKIKSPHLNVIIFMNHGKFLWGIGQFYSTTVRLIISSCTSLQSSTKKALYPATLTIRSRYSSG